MSNECEYVRAFPTIDATNTQLVIDASNVGLGAVRDTQAKPMSLATQVERFQTWRGDIRPLKRKPWLWFGHTESSTLICMVSTSNSLRTTSRWRSCMDRNRNPTRESKGGWWNWCRTLSESLDKDVESYVRSCHGCQVVSSMPHPEPISSTPMPSGPWQDMSIDRLGTCATVEFITGALHHSTLRRTAK